ncbi:hypothetical protein ACJX0J_008702 [Zea mays]
MNVQEQDKRAEESESSNWDAVKCIDEDITSVDPCLVESESSESDKYRMGSVGIKRQLKTEADNRERTL